MLPFCKRPTTIASRPGVTSSQITSRPTPLCPLSTDHSRPSPVPFSEQWEVAWVSGEERVTVFTYSTLLNTFTATGDASGRASMLSKSDSRGQWLAFLIGDEYALIICSDGNVYSGSSSTTLSSASPRLEFGNVNGWTHSRFATLTPDGELAASSFPGTGIPSIGPRFKILNALSIERTSAIHTTASLQSIELLVDENGDYVTDENDDLFQA